MPEYSIKEVKGGHVVLDPEGHQVYPGKAGIMSERDAYNLADEMRFEGKPGGSGAQLLEELHKLVSGDRYVSEAGDKLNGALFEQMMDSGGIGAKEFEKIYRSSDVPLAMMEMGNTGGFGPEAIYRALGHDAVIMNNAEKAFPGMRLHPGTTHVALFDPRRVRSTEAAFDPKRINSRNLLAGAAGVATLPGIVLDQNYGRD